MPGRKWFQGTIPVFTEGGPATSAVLNPTSEPEVDGSIATAAEMCVSAPCSASAAGAYALVFASECDSPFADASCPASVVASADPGFA